jgi:hypothetical protein
MAFGFFLNNFLEKRLGRKKPKRMVWLGKHVPPDIRLRL